MIIITFAEKAMDCGRIRIDMYYCEYNNIYVFKWIINMVLGYGDLLMSESLCVCVCVCACVGACMCVCVRACVCVCVLC